MKTLSPTLVFSLALLLCLPFVVQAKQSSINPWTNDPLAKINFNNDATKASKENKFAENSLERDSTISNEPKTKCRQITNFCPVCETVEEWPIDFDGDDLAEKAQKRVCAAIPTSPATKDIPQSYQIPEIIIIYSYLGEALIYKTTLNSCSKKTHFTTFQRFDFNADNYDELILVEKDFENNDEKINVIGFFNDRISELPFVDFTPDLEEYLPKDETSKVIKNFKRTNGKMGFIMQAQSQSGRGFEIYYYQDSSERAFYPLRIIPDKNKNRANNLYKAKTETKLLGFGGDAGTNLITSPNVKPNESFIVYESKRSDKQ